MGKARNIFWREHSLSIVVSCVLLLWLGLYSISDQHKHLGGFYGNAIADWSGLLTTILITKSFYEKGSAESRHPPRPRTKSKLWCFLQNHSMSVFLVVTGLLWTVLYMFIDPQSKWGQVVGNIVSEWTQIFCLVIFTKGLSERHSKESKH